MTKHDYPTNRIASGLSIYISKRGERTRSKTEADNQPDSDPRRCYAHSRHRKWRRAGDSAARRTWADRGRSLTCMFGSTAPVLARNSRQYPPLAATLARTAGDPGPDRLLHWREAAHPPGCLCDFPPPGTSGRRWGWVDMTGPKLAEAISVLSRTPCGPGQPRTCLPPAKAALALRWNSPATAGAMDAGS